MKIRLFEEPVKKEQEFLLRLKQDRGQVELVPVDPKGESILNGILLIITEDMRLNRFGNINKNLGLPLDASGKLEEVSE